MPRSVNQIDVQSSGLCFDPTFKRENCSRTVGHMTDVILQTADGRLQLQCGTVIVLSMSRRGGFI